MPLPILLYHEISSQDRYCLDCDKFSRQMQFLSENGYQTIVTADLAADIAGLEKRIMVTFDDGYETDLTKVYQILNKYGYRGVCFVTTGFIGIKRYLSWEQIKVLHSQGFDIQSHTHTHPLLATISPEKIREELSKSKDILEQKLGKKVIAISFPGGSFNQKIVNMAKDCGYEYVFTTKPEINMNHSQLWHRFLVKHDLVLEDFKKVIAGDSKFYRNKLYSYKLRRIMKNIIGKNYYLKIWRKFYKENI